MKHYGDITKINGAEAPVVDIITGGSPCQDLSVAGKRAGLAGERSGLFMEQMRLVKEMRERERATGRTGWMVRPRYMVWENVPGAFSSGNPKGADFAAVIEEIIKVAEPGAAVSVCVPNGGWTKSGCYYAEDGSWSVAWRVHDAQFWGVPQRRKRISLVADFGGLSAPEILFERKGLSGNSEQSGAKREEAAAPTGGGAEGASGAMNPWDSQTARGYPDNGVWHCLNANENGVQSRDAVFCLQGNGIDRADTAGCNGKGWREDVSYTLNTIDRPAVAFGCDVYNQEITGDVAASLTAASGGSNTSGPKVIERQESAVYDGRGNGDGKTVCTITGDHENRVTDYTALCVGNGQANQSVSDKAGALNTMHDQQAVIVLPFDTTQITSPQNGNNPHYGDPCHPLAAGAHAPSIATCMTPLDNQASRCFSENGIMQSLASRENAGQNQQSVLTASTVRRLTPLECERLQGYPDGWTDIGEWADSNGKKHGEADSPRYKALGNSIALPFWQWMARRICAQYERPVTMASLFDGIGGFPLVFQRCGAVPVWASEIEEFPIAVTKVRFPDENVI